MKNLVEYLTETKYNEKYYSLFFEDFVDLNKNQKIDDILSEIKPECTLKSDKDYNDNNQEIKVNGKWVDFFSENVNFYKENQGKNIPMKGDLVFEVLDQYAVYRQGLGIPTGLVDSNCSIGTREELVNYLIEFKKDFEKDYNIDIDNLVK
jgi:hypothetical protein